MGRIIKALILGWIGKKIYDRVAADDPTDHEKRAVPHAKRTTAKRSARRPTRRAA